MPARSTISNAVCSGRFLGPACVLCAGVCGGVVLGGWIGWALDRFPALGLTPVRFWRTDPENVWAWSLMIGGASGFALAASALLWRARKRPAASPSTRD